MNNYFFNSFLSKWNKPLARKKYTKIKHEINSILTKLIKKKHIKSTISDYKQEIQRFLRIIKK